MSRQHINNDPRWGWVDKISDALAILSSIETHRRFVRAQAAHADMHNVVLNLRQILSEVSGMAEEIEKLKTQLADMQSDLIQAIYQVGAASRIFKLRDHPGSCDIGAAYKVTDHEVGTRYRRVRLSDYTQNQ
jgi:hypothetical protein